MRTAKLIILSSLLVTGLFTSSCSINPATKSPDFVTMSEDKEISIGKEMHEKILAETPIYQDEKIQKYVDKVGQKVAAAGDRPDLTYHFTIIDSPDINAFALPGGYIYINRGLIGYLNSEAQLAAVLAHEVAHVTARHAVRQKTAATGASVLSVLSAIVTRSSVVGDATNLWSTAAVMGYGRDMELEADGFGAQYLFNSGYDPQAMAEVIGVLKDQEKYSRRRAREKGKKQTNYHGVFSTHPRNDKRLQGVIAKAGTLPSDKQGVTNEIAFREQVEGLIFGVNYLPSAGKPSDQNRFIHNRLGFTLVFPDQWEVKNQHSSIVAAPQDKSAQLSLKIELLNKKIAPRDYIRTQLGIPLLTKSESIAQFGLIGHTGIKPASEQQPHPSRVAVLYQGRRVYIFEGSVDKPQEAVDYDALFLDSIHSFRPARSQRRGGIGKVKKIHYVRANEKTTFDALARYHKLGTEGEAQLRLLNGYYPRGEPKPGEWIKIIR